MKPSWYRRMKEISWRNRMSKQEIFRRAEEHNALWKGIQSRSYGLIGHTLRHESLLKAILEGTLEKKDVTPFTICPAHSERCLFCGSCIDMKMRAQNRTGWKSAKD